jgi:RNA-binding protein YlmH
MGLLERLMNVNMPQAEVKVVVEAYDRAIATRRPQLTLFLGKESIDLLKEAIQSTGDADGRVYGGYRGSSRSRFAIAHAEYEWEDFKQDLGFFSFQAHDIGAEELVNYIKASGISEGELGDIFVVEGMAFGISTEAAATRLTERGVDVQGIPARVALADPYEIPFPGQGRKELRATVASMRLDSVAACGFPASRTRLASEIEIGRAKLNGRQVIDSAAKVRQGDVIVFRGRGRLVVEEEGAVTKKGRISLRITKYSIL